MGRFVGSGFILGEPRGVMVNPALPLGTAGYRRSGA
jgi:hypothetical protein